MKIMKLLDFLLFLWLATLAKSQFLYNYEDESEPPASDAYDPAQYQYNPPSTTNQQYLQPVRSNYVAPSPNVRPSAPRSAPRRYEPEPDNYPEPMPQAQAEFEPPPTEYRQERRTQRRRQRQRSRTRYYEEEPTQPPRVYSPSVFEKVGLGQAPSGVYVPQDSLLNILRDPPSRAPDSYVEPRQREEINPPMTNDQPYRTYPQRQSQPRFYVEPPMNEERPRPERVILPVRRPAPPATVRSRQRSQYRREYSVAPEPESEQEYYRRIGESETQIQETRRQSRPGKRIQDANQGYERVSAHRPSSQQSQLPVNVVPKTATPKPAKLSIAALPTDTDGDGIPGEGGMDYPTLHVIPETSFSCGQQPHNGYYADLETSCQVVHMCQAGGVKSSFLCPNGTIFSQEKFACQWWYKVNCVDSPRYYGINDNLYKVPSREGK